MRELEVVVAGIDISAEVVAVQRHKEQGERHDVQDLEEDGRVPAEDLDRPDVVKPVVLERLAHH